MEVATRKSQPLIHTAPPAEPVERKLTIEKFADGPFTCLKFVGTIDESFDGKKIGKTIEAEWLVLDLGGVKKISSFGIREWVDFMATASKQSKQLTLIEAAPKVVDQLNMVANFAGSGRVFSFYAPFRCDYCDSEQRVLLEVAKDFEAIKAMKLAERPCPTCKESMYFDEDGSTYFSFILGQGQFELEPEVVAFLAAKLDYRIGTIDAKLRVDKAIDGRITYLRLSGDLNNQFPREKLAEGLEGVVIVDVGGVPRVEPAGAAEWRSFVQQVAPLVENLYLIGVPPPFLEKLCGPDDLGTKAQVVDLSLPYACTKCGTTMPRLISVAEHHAVLKFATAPELACTQCKTAMQCHATEAMMTILPGLAKPAVGKDLEKKIDELRARKFDKKPSTGLVGIPKHAEAQARGGIGAGTLALIVLVLAAVGAAGLLLYQRFTQKEPGKFGLGAIVARSAPQRPAWIKNDAPGAVECTPTGGANGGTSCVGASQLLASQEEAEDEASDGAYEGVAFASAKAGTTVAPSVLETRATAFAALARDPLSTQARRDVHDGRHAAARVIRRSAPPVMERYWEAYDSPEGRKFIAYALVAAGGSEIAKLAAKHEASALGATVADFDAELGWRYPKLDHGAVVTKLEHGVLQDIGLAEHYIVIAVDGHDVADAASFAKLVASEYTTLEERGGALRLLVQTETGDPREFSTTLQGKQNVPATNPGKTPHNGKHGHDDHGQGGVNVWDRFGGNRGSGRDDPTQ